MNAERGLVVRALVSLDEGGSVLDGMVGDSNL